MKLYHVYEVSNGMFRITDEPLTLEMIKQVFGDISKLERTGHRIVLAN